MKGVAVGLRVVICCLVSGCLISPVMRFGEGKSARESQRDLVAEHIAPSTFERSHDWDGKVRSVRIRVWADDAYRAQNMHWQQTFEDEIAHANEVLGGLFGVQLVAEFRIWSRAAPDATLEDTIEALAALDPGDDVLTVVGLTSSLGLVAATFERLGFAEIGGRHMILRGYADLEERKLFDRVFTELREEERELLYQARRRHKTTGVLLHELGHNLGADHVADEDTLMHAAYSEHASKFDPRSRDVILASLDQRLARQPAVPDRGTAAPVRETAAPAREATRPSVAQAATQLMIDLDAEGRISTNGNSLSDDDLDALLATIARADRSAEVILRYSKHTPREAVVTALDHVQTAKLKVSLARYR